MSEILDDMQIHILAENYGLYPADLLYENRDIDNKGKRWCSLSARDRSTGILIKYDADLLEYE